MGYLVIELVALVENESSSSVKSWTYELASSSSTAGSISMAESLSEPVSLDMTAPDASSEQRQQVDIPADVLRVVRLIRSGDMRKARRTYGVPAL
jgi:guanyl-specific ribonuclease Sa